MSGGGGGGQETAPNPQEQTENSDEGTKQQDTPTESLDQTSSEDSNVGLGESLGDDLAEEQDEDSDQHEVEQDSTVFNATENDFAVNIFKNRNRFKNRPQLKKRAKTEDRPRQRYKVARNNSTSRFSRKLDQKLRSHFGRYRKPKHVRLRHFKHNQRLGFINLRGARYELTKSFGDSFACLGKICDYELGRIGGNGIAAYNQNSTFRVCRQTNKRHQKFKCWKNERGLIHLGRQLLRDRRLSRRQKSDVFMRALTAFNPRLAKEGYVCTPNGCFKVQSLSVGNTLSSSAASALAQNQNPTDNAESADGDESNNEDQQDDESQNENPESTCAEPQFYQDPETGEIYSADQVKDKPG